MTTPATDGKVIEITGSKEGQSRTIAVGVVASANPSGNITANLGNSNEASTSSQVTRNMSQITEFHDDGIIDWGFDVDDSNFQQMAANTHEKLLPTVDFEFCGKASELPERMDFVVASHWSMIPPGKQASTQNSKQNWVQTFINRVKSPNNKPAQSISYSNLFQVVALKTNPSKLPTWYGYRATVDVQSTPNLQGLEHPEAPKVSLHFPELDPTTVNVTPTTFDGGYMLKPV